MRVTILAIGRKAAKALEREAVLFASSRRLCAACCNGMNQAA
jgi:hypothetical protein